VNCELPDVQAGCRKGRGTRDQIANITGSWKKQESSRKTSISTFFNHFFNLILFFNFTILYWFCHISKWIRYRYTCVPHPEPSSLLPPHTPMFIAALFIIARTWNQPRCPSADEWIRKLWYIYTMEYICGTYTQYTQPLKRIHLNQF